MNLSLFFAQIIGPLMTIIGISMLSDPKRYKSMIDSMKANSITMHTMGMFVAIIGLVIIVTHNVWIKNWIVIITILGWISLIKGALFMLDPDMMIKHAKKRKEFLQFGGIFSLVVGLYLSYMGFFV